MKRHLFAASAALALTATACGVADEEAIVEEAGELTEKVYDTQLSCMAEQCFDIKARKDISFIAVEAEACPGTSVSLRLMEPDGTVVNVTPELHGQGRSCPGIAPDALKFEGLTLDYYVLCVVYDGSATVGDVTITTKAGRGCHVMTHEASCQSCGEGGGTGGNGTGGGETGGNGTGGDCP